jgi:hypothetical protein
VVTRWIAENAHRLTTVDCDTHAHWRRQTIRLPTLVRRMPPTERASI